ncbi:MAG: hypothetical protein O3A19_00180 [Planctomycetota bacterium]|nr:hypothetical protein [Planctomycetota bacterium]
MLLTPRGEEQLDLESNAPLADAGGTLHVIESLQLDVDGLSADSKHLANPAANWNRPSIVGIGLPVGRDDRSGGGGDVPAVVQVVVDEWLHQQCVHIRSTRSGVRPDILNQSTDHL